MWLSDAAVSDAGRPLREARSASPPRVLVLQVKEVDGYLYGHDIDHTPDSSHSPPHVAQMLLSGAL